MEPNQEGVFEALQEHISLRHDVLLLIREERKAKEKAAREHEAKSEE